jgi:DNA (cytosine-5)-methyltransferase 1
MDLFTYSFPCQDLSIAGKKEGLKEGTRSGLLYECEKIIEIKKPKYLLLENVKNLVGKQFKSDFDKWLNYLESLGYKNYWKVLNAKDYGVPQSRERVFVVSVLGEHKPYTFPQPIKLNRAIKDILEDTVEEKYYFKSATNTRLDGFLSKMAKFEGDIVTCDSTIYNPKKINIANCITARYDAGIQNKQSIGVAVVDRRLEEDKARKLTPLECWRLMSFTDEDFYKAKNAGISNSQLYKQAGNSIVVKVLEGIFKNLLIDNEQVKEITTEEEKRKDRNMQLKWCI